MIQTMEFRAMNTAIVLAGEGEGIFHGMQAAKQFIHESEQRFSRFLPASEVSALNASAGQWQPVSSELMDMLQLSMKYYFETRGLFDPSILSDLKSIGYDRSMDEIRAQGGTTLPHASKRTSKPAFHEMELNPADNLVRMPHGMEIDLGGIAKGWIVDRAAHLLHTYAHACGVSAGGDILFLGTPEDGLDWDVYLEDPRDPSLTSSPNEVGGMLTQLHISSGAVATSSVMKRTWSQGEKSRHHLIDPRTGESAETYWLSVTAIAPDVLTAEVYAKAILIGGEEALPNLLHARPELTFIAVDPNGNLLGSPNYKDYMYESTTDTHLSIDITY
jgi:thiamine biosynthesis lipoprotein